VVRLPGHKSYVWSLAFSKDGAMLASGSGDATVRLWDTAPMKARYQARREGAALRLEAERLVEQLWRAKNDPAEVVAALRAGQVPSEALRQAALRAVLCNEKGDILNPVRHDCCPKRASWQERRGLHRRLSARRRGARAARLPDRNRCAAANAATPARG
jgi:hypothetical protein